MARAVPVDFLISGLTDASGNPLSGGKIYTYSAGTTSPKDTWQDHLKVTPHANPIVLDAQGKKLVFADGTYKFRIDDSAGVTLYTHDNLLFGFDDGAYVYLGTSAGTATAQTASASPALSGYVAGQVFRMIIGGGLGSTGTSPTAHTLNINGLGAKNIVENYGSSNPTIGTWVAGAMIELLYDGTNFRIMNVPTGWQAFSPSLSVPAGNATAISYAISSFKRHGREVHFDLVASWTQNAANANYVQFVCPVLPSFVSQAFSGFEGSANATCHGFISSLVGSGSFQVYKYNAAVFAAAANHSVSLRGSYIAD